MMPHSPPARGVVKAMLAHPWQNGKDAINRTTEYFTLSPPAVRNDCRYTSDCNVSGWITTFCRDFRISDDMSPELN
jgi:hypothetical protein